MRGCVRKVAPDVSCCSAIYGTTAIRLPACAPAQEHLWRSGRLKWAVWSTLSEKMGSWRRLGIRTPYAPYGGGVLHREGDRYV